MKALFVGVGVCCVLLAGCGSTDSNDFGLSADVRERVDSDWATLLTPEPASLCEEFRNPESTKVDFSAGAYASGEDPDAVIEYMKSKC